MFKFKSFINENVSHVDDLAKHPVLYNFLHHLSSPTLHHEEVHIEEAHEIEHILGKGKENAPEGNLFSHLRNGFHNAFPEDEHIKPEDDEKTQKDKAKLTADRAKESRKHFRQFMHERGGLAKNNTTNLTGDNGKTRLSTGEGMQTLGLSLAPHSSSGYKHNLCPKASTECKKNCLGFTAGGNKQYPETAFRAKLLRTHYLAEHPEHAARLMSHEISENEKWASEHHSLHDKSGNIVGYKHVKSGKIKSEDPKAMSHDEVARAHQAKELTEKKIKSGFRPNVTSDIPYEKLMPKHFFDRHHKTQFYDYTKVAGRLDNKDMPKNYSLALSHTGTGHEESNDRDAIKHLEKGGVVAMVHQRSKVTPTHVEDVQTGKRYPIVNGDEDDNVYDRHRQAGLPKTQGVVSGLKLKGVSNEAAGKFANKVDPDGVIRINHPQKKKIPIASA